MPHHRDNFLLNLLEPEVFDRIEPQLSIIDLHIAQVLAETHQRIEKVYFPHSGIISCVVELKGGGAIETGMIGKDGATDLLAPTARFYGILLKVAPAAGRP